MPLRIGDVHVPQVGRQHRQQALRILLAAIPVHQGTGGEPVSEVMQTRSVAVVLATQADLARQRVEDTADLSAVKPVPPTGGEQVRRHRPAGPMTLATGHVLGEDLAGGAMQRNKTGPGELGVAYGQQSRVEVDIAQLEIACFGQAMDPRTEVPSPGLLPFRPRRATPYLYSDDEIRNLLRAALHMPHRYRQTALLPWVYYCLFGLLSVAGLRLGDAARNCT